MEFVAKSKKIRVVVDDQEHWMKYPTVGQRQQFWEDQLKDSKPEDMVKKYVSWFEFLGLPKEGSLGMDNDTFLKFVEYISNPTEKKTI